MSKTNESKAEARRAYREVRQNISAEARRRKSFAAAEVALSLLSDHHQTVAIFASMADEISTAHLCAELKKRSRRVLYPRVPQSGLRLEFCEGPLSSTGALGVREPAQDAVGVALLDIHAFVVPGLVFDRRGYRVGFGKGYYDVTLAGHPSALRLGFAFAEQMTEAVPNDTYDEPVDWTATDMGAIKGRPLL